MRAEGGCVCFVSYNIAREGEISGMYKSRSLQTYLTGNGITFLPEREFLLGEAERPFELF